MGLGAAVVILLIGVSLILLSWWNTYPLYLASIGEYTFDKVYPAYWMGLALSYLGALGIAALSKDRRIRFACCFLFVLLSYSSYFFYSFLPGPDSPYFTALTLRYDKTGSLLPSNVIQDYYQWPLLFVLARTVSSVMDLTIDASVKVLFVAWNLALAAGLFTYYLKRDITNAHMALMAYVVAVYGFLDWQFSPQTLGLVFLICSLIILDRDSLSARLVLLVSYTALVLTHPFTPAFLILLFFFMFLWRPRRYGIILAVTSAIYLFYLAFRGIYLLEVVSAITTAFLDQYQSIFMVVAREPLTRLDAIAQFVSRAITLSMWALLASGTLMPLIRRRLPALDTSLITTTISYGAAGAVIPILGFRAIQVFFIPAAQGIQFLHRMKRVRPLIFIYLMISASLFPLALLHQNYQQLNYASIHERSAADFLLIYEGSRNYVIGARILIAQYMAALAPSEKPFTYGRPDQSWTDANYLLINAELMVSIHRRAGAQAPDIEGAYRIYDNSQSQIYFFSVR